MANKPMDKVHKYNADTALERASAALKKGDQYGMFAYIGEAIKEINLGLHWGAAEASGNIIAPGAGRSVKEEFLLLLADLEKHPDFAARVQEIRKRHALDSDDDRL